MVAKRDPAVIVSLVLAAVVVAATLVALAIQNSFPWWVDVLLVASAIAAPLTVWLVVRRPGRRSTSGESAREPLFSLRLPEPPRSGQIDNYETVLFEKVLATKHAAGERALRFGLSMPGREFLDFGDFQEIWRDRPAIHSTYLSNPLDLPTNRQGMLAFAHASGSSGVAKHFELAISDSGTQLEFTVTELGEHTFYDDGSVRLVAPASEVEGERRPSDRQAAMTAADDGGQPKKEGSREVEQPSGGWLNRVAERVTDAPLWKLSLGISGIIAGIAGLIAIFSFILGGSGGASGPTTAAAGATTLAPASTTATIVRVLPPIGTQANDRQITWVGESTIRYQSFSPYSIVDHDRSLVLTPGRRIVLRAGECMESDPPQNYVWTFRRASIGNGAELPITVDAVVDDDGRSLGCLVGVTANTSLDEEQGVEVLLEYTSSTGEPASATRFIVLRPVGGYAEVFVVDGSSRMAGDRLTFARAAIAQKILFMEDATVTGLWVAGGGIDPDACSWSRTAGPDPKAPIEGEVLRALKDMDAGANTRPDFSGAIIDALQKLGDHPSRVDQSADEKVTDVIIFTGGGDTCFTDDGSQLAAQEAFDLAQGQEAQVFIRGYLVGLAVEPEDPEWLELQVRFLEVVASAEVAEGYICEIDAEALSEAVDFDREDSPLRGFYLSRYCASI